MEKILYIHIGAHKTGTTAIQRFLSMNRDNLMKKGFYYPGKYNAPHFIPHGLLNKTFLFSDPEEMTIKTFNEIRKSKYKNIIISSEAFVFLKKEDIFILKNNYLNDFSVKIIFYVRRQDEMAESRYNQIIRSSRYTEPFSIYISSKPQMDNLDYDMVLRPWREVFGLENMIVRVYEKQQLPNGIFSDFLSAVGSELDESYKFPKITINQSLNWDFIEIIRLCNTQFKEDTHINRYLVKEFAMIDMGKNREKCHLLSPLQRHDIMEMYKDSNAKVAREYLGREDGRLFYSPLPDPDEPWEPYEGLTVEKVVPIFTQMLYNMDVKYQKQIKTMQKSPYKNFIRKKMRLSRNVLKRWKNDLFK